MPSKQVFRSRKTKGLVTMGISVSRDIETSVRKLAEINKRSIQAQIALIVEAALDKDGR